MRMFKSVLVGLLVMAAPIVSEAGGKAGVADYRWRNDDGGEGAAGASWKAEPHTPIIGVQRDTNIRLRFAYGCDGQVTFTNMLAYATSSNGPWTVMTTDQPTHPFRITSTAWYADGASTTAQLPVSGKTFQPGKCVESPSVSFVASLSDSNKYTEVEWCMQATPYALRNKTYYVTPCKRGANGIDYLPCPWYPQLTIEDADPTNAPTDYYVDDADVNAKAVPFGVPLVTAYTNGAWMGGCKYCMPPDGETNRLDFRWTPDLPKTGEYNVYARWTCAPLRGRQVPYTITHASGTSPEIFVNQRDPALSGQWNLLGTYTFNAGTNGWVDMGADGGQACADAVRFEVVGGAPPPDADGDGMLDLWENTYLGGTNASPTADADLDGMNNLQEFLAGTLPNNSSSLLALVGLTGSGQNLDLKWLSADGKTYEILKSTNLTAGFTISETNGIDATPPTNSYTVTLGTGGSGFYRVKLETGN